MNFENAKREVVKKCWVAEIGEEQFLRIEIALNPNGFLHEKRYATLATFNNEAPEQKIIVGQIHYRPKSLQGIENNNGWIRIEADGSNLPTDVETVYNLWWLNDRNNDGVEMPWNVHDVRNQHERGKVTHYKPIEKSKPPVV